MPELEQDPERFDPSARRLCPDGSCVGVIGPEGRCKVCGLSDGGGPASEAPASFAREDVDVEDAVVEAPTGGFDPNRKLCVDGSCIGVIGADGRCTECSRAAEA
jgi:hypothetical protein